MLWPLLRMAFGHPLCVFFLASDFTTLHTLSFRIRLPSNPVPLPKPKPSCLDAAKRKAGFPCQRMDSVELREGSEPRLLSVKAGEGGSQDFQKVAGVPEVVIHVVVVGVGMVAVPVQDVVPHIQGVARQVCWGIPQAMELVPQYPLLPATRQ